MSKYIIRVTDDELPQPWYVGRIKADGEPQRVAVNFAKRYENYDLAEAVADTMRRRRSDRDGASALIEVVDAATGNPPEIPEEPPQLPDDAPETAAEQIEKSDYTPPTVQFPDKPGEKWMRQVSCTFGADKTVTLQMCRTPEGMRYRYTDEYGIPFAQTDSWVAAADAFFSYCRWKYYNTLIDFEAKKAQKN